MILPAKKLCLLSKQAYNKCTVEAGGTEVLIKTVRKITVFAFRGTTFDGVDILTDLRACPWWSKEVGTFVHKGFLEGVRAIWPLLPMSGPNPGEIVLTGHSKGGAEAILLGAFMVQCGIPVAQIETFGAPRVGFSGLGEILKGVLGNRNRLGNDIVPTRPLPFPIPYRHDRELKETPDGDDNFDPFENHRIADYCKAML